MRVKTRRRFIILGLAVCAIGAAGMIATRAREHEAMSGAIPYGKGQRERLDVYAPESKGGADRPVVVYFYGGAWQSGNLLDSRAVGQTLAAQGIVAVTPNFRNYPATIFPGFLDDAAAAVRWTRDHAREYGGNPDRIFVMGHSSGAHIAAMIATDPSYLAAQGMSNTSLAGMIGLAGPYAAFQTTDPHMDEIFPAALRPRALPITFVSGKEPPMLLGAGTADTDVDPRNSERFADALRAHHDNVELKKYPGFGHDTVLESFTSKPQADAKESPVLADVMAFINAH